MQQFIISHCSVSWLDSSSSGPTHIAAFRRQTDQKLSSAGMLQWLSFHVVLPPHGVLTRPLHMAKTVCQEGKGKTLLGHCSPGLSWHSTTQNMLPGQSSVKGWRHGLHFLMGRAANNYAQRMD